MSFQRLRTVCTHKPVQIIVKVLVELKKIEYLQKRALHIESTIF